MAAARLVAVEKLQRSACGAASRHVWTDANCSEQIHLGAQSHVGARRPGPDMGMLELARILVYYHVLKDVERARNVFDCNAVGGRYITEVLCASPRRHFGQRPLIRYFPNSTLRSKLMPLAATHTFLQIVVAFIERIFDYHHHRAVEFRDQQFPVYMNTFR